jgi:hypothetical protein
MNGNQLVGLALITLAFVGFIMLIRYRRTHRAPAPATSVRDAEPPIEIPALSESDERLGRLLRTLYELDDRADHRIGSLKLYLFFLPFIWSVIWGIVYLISR